MIKNKKEALSYIYGVPTHLIYDISPNKYRIGARQYRVYNFKQYNDIIEHYGSCPCDYTISQGYETYFISKIQDWITSTKYDIIKV